MRILVVHNRYQQAGGEDVVFEAECKLLLENGHVVDQLIFDNKNLSGFWSQVKCGLGLFYNLRSAALMKRKLEEFFPDVIHVHNFFPVASPSILYVASRFGIPVVQTLHNYRLLCPSATLFYRGGIYENNVKANFPLNAILNGVYQQSIIKTAAVATGLSFHNLIGTWRKKVSHFIVLTDFALQKFSESSICINRDQYIVKPNFVNDTGVGFHQRERFYLFVGRLCEEKGIQVVLKAACRYHFNLVIMGDGPMRELVLQHCRDYSNITYNGFSGNASVIAQMKRCIALIFPSLWYEGFPITIAECFSTGTPVIASDIGAMAHIIENGVNGLHFRAGDENDLIRKVLMLDSSPQLASSLGRNARLTFQNLYTKEINYNKLMGIYNAAIAKHGKGSNISDMKTSKKVNTTIQDLSVPKITIGIPTYNGARRIRKALNSVFAQTYPNLEILISDNCSSDNTSEVCMSEINDHPEITYYRQSSNIGLVPNFDFVLSRATGEYFMWLADDDELEANTLPRYVEFLRSHIDYSLVSGSVYYWKGSQLDYIENGLSLAAENPALRSLGYYFKVIYGGLFHGMMRTATAKEVMSMNVFGNDFHFVAAMAFKGKIKNFYTPAYHKQLGGFSKDVAACARAIGEKKIAVKFPYIKIALDSFSSITSDKQVYHTLPMIQRYFLGLSAIAARLICYYGRVYPFTIAGRCKAIVLRLLKIENPGSFFKKRSLMRMSR